jgi:RHS repeat-associated protein
MPGSTDPTEQHFTGKERDTESGLDYFGARYLASSMGRFSSPDDGSDQDPSNPQSWNLYAYTRNNPLVNTDPTGHDCVGTTDGGNTVLYQTGACDGSIEGGVYVDGTVDPSSFTYNENTSSYDFKYTDSGGLSWGGSVAGPDYDPWDGNATASGVFGAQTAGQWGASANTVNLLGGIEFTVASFLAPELLGEEAPEALSLGAESEAESGATANKINHIFGNAEHNLDSVAQASGGESKAYQALQQATTEATKGMSGQFETTVQVAGQNVVVRGVVMNGVAKIGTAFIQ